VIILTEKKGYFISCGNLVNAVKMSSQKCSGSECISVQLRGQNVNYGLLWVGGPAEETSVDTDFQSKIMMGGWIGGRDICGHSVNQRS